jgi:ankyrin repeat protein
MFCSKIIFLLLLSWQSVDINDKEDFLHKASDGDFEQVKAFVEAGVDLEAKNRYGMTALYVAARNGHKDLVKYLLDKGADPNVKDTFYNENLVSMMLYEEKPDLNMVRQLLANGAKVTEGMLVSATNPDKKEVLAVILEHKPEGIDRALNQALAEDQTELMDMLLKVAKPEDLSEVLTNAKFLGNQAAIKKLTEAGAKADDPFKIEDLKPFAGSYALDSGYTVKVVLEDGTGFTLKT